MKRIVLFLILFLLLWSYGTHQLFAANLLLNSSFEEGTSNWTKNVSTVTFTLSSTAAVGTASAYVTKTNGTTGTIYVYQDVDIEPETYYSLTGAISKNSPQFSWALLRVSWRNSSQEISKTDSDQVASDKSEFQRVKVASVQAPSTALKARVELVGNLSSGNPTNAILFDDIIFTQIEAPEQPTALPPTKEPEPTSMPTRTLAPTKKPSVTAKVKEEAVLAEKTKRSTQVLEDEESEVSGSREVFMDVSVRPTHTPAPAKRDPSIKPLHLTAGSFNFQGFFGIVVGLILCACAILAYLRLRK